MIKKLFPLLAMMAAAGTVSAADAPEAKDKVLRLSRRGVHGKVIDARGRAVAGVRVTLRRATGGAPVHATTDKDGAFTFATLATDAYILDVGGRLSLNVEVSAQGTVNNLKVLFPENKNAEGAETDWRPLAVGGAILILAGVGIGIGIAEGDDNVSP